METIKRSWRKTPSSVRKVLVSIIGSLVVLAGVLMLALPGPGWVTIFLGLAIFATEFPRAKKAKDWITHRFKSALNSLQSKNK